MTEALKVCPFCGAEAEEYVSRYRYHVICDTCKRAKVEIARTYNLELDDERARIEAIRIWNTRSNEVR